jgi:pimeloyl-ACP methyl ester carboxylesterase
VLFVHGYLDSWRIWEAALPYLPMRHRLLFVTQRGFGDSDKPAGGFAQLDYVRDLEAFLDALGLGAAAIVGHSMGGLIAHFFAVRNPQRTTRLVLAGTAPTAAGSEIVGGSFMAEIGRLADPIDPAFVRQAQTEQMRSPVPGSVLEGIVFESRKAPARAWQGALAGMLAEDHASRLPEIACPTLILYGDGDMYFTPEDQRRFQRLIPQARLKVYPGVGHGLQWEKPAEFAADVGDFLAA